MRHPIDLSVYLVLDPDLCGGAQGMIETTRAAVQNGATVTGAALEKKSSCGMRASIEVCPGRL